MHEPLDDAALAGAFAAGDRSAFEEAYRRFGRLLYSTAYNVLGNAEDSQDAVHDALTRVWRTPNAYTRERGALKSYLTVCVRNEAITRARSKQRRLRLATRIGEEPIEHEELHLVDPYDRDRLRAAMSALPPEQRAPLELAYFKQLSHSEIARELDQPLGTVKSRIAMGLKKLAAAVRAS